MRFLSDYLLTCVWILVVFPETTPSDLHREDLFGQLKAMILNATAGKIESSINTCRQYNYYYYKQLVCVNSSPPNIFKAFNDSNQRETVNLIDTRKVKGKFLTVHPVFEAKSYGIKYNEILVLPNGKVEIDVSGMKVVLSSIQVLNGHRDSHLIETISNVIYLAIRWPELNIQSNQKLYKAQVILTIYPNGVISIYYENIPDVNDTAHWKSSSASYKWITGGGFHSKVLNVPESMIKTGTTVYYEPTEKYCSKSESVDECSNASTPEVECYWCKEIGKCSNGYDMNTKHWRERQCDVTLLKNKLSTVSSLGTSDSDLKTTSSLKTLVPQQTTTTQMDLHTSPTSYLASTLTQTTPQNLSVTMDSGTTTATPKSRITSSTINSKRVVTTITSQMNLHKKHTGGTRLFLYIFLPISLLLALVSIIFGVMYLKKKLNVLVIATSSDEQDETNVP